MSKCITHHEDWLRKQLKVIYLGLASFERTIARQRARIAFLKDGDANTSFFHRQCTFRRQKNRIHSLMSSGRVVTDHADMAEAAFDHFDALLGTAVDRDCTLDGWTSRRSSSPPPTSTSWTLPSPLMRSGVLSSACRATKRRGRTASRRSSYAHVGLSSAQILWPRSSSCTT
jgi:hypothetical protein